MNLWATANPLCKLGPQGLGAHLSLDSDSIKEVGKASAQPLLGFSRAGAPPTPTRSSPLGFSRAGAAPRLLPFESFGTGVYDTGMADLIHVRASPRHSLSVHRSSSVRPPPASQVTVRFTNPLFCSAKLHKARPLVAAALEVSKDSSSTGLANRQPSKGVIETWRNADAVCFDVDSTVCLDEGIDELADFCGAGQAVAEWTAKAMTGTVPFEEALAARLSLIKPSLSQVEECLEKRPPRISPGMADLIKKLKANNTDVFLVSGGFRQMIKPVAFELGIPPENIIANQLLFGTSGEYAGFDPTEPTSRSGGKARAVQQIRQDHGYKTIIMIGDGATDLEARQPGGADLFFCYAGVQMREAVAAKADWAVFNFQELIAELP
ncbi:phosphoserine phosphatase, chloroplastic-like [Phragmites australis]|uniref:phosphoserine phosphatase, chloroplastic-like n=1 Tax=Phragmites australis TaxID=29695 RepID=UPI002D79A2F4|nr:phosphoserine phosphatase, chloroplastic-like [Phragmites australis]